MPSFGNREIIGIQYLRGIAAMAVVLSHAGGFAGLDKYFGNPLAGDLLHGGRRGVDLFFLVSGFIIAIIALRGPDLSAKVSPRHFFERRFSRIVPIMWIAIIAHVSLQQLTRGTVDPAAFLRAMTLFPAGRVEPPQIWTLRHEMLFYIVFAIAFLAPRRLPFVLGIWCVLPILGLFLPESDSASLSGEDFLRVVFSPVNFEFGAGFLIAVAWLRRRRAWRIRLPIHPFLLLSLAMVPLAAIDNWLGVDFPRVPSRLLFALLCAPIVVIGIGAECPPGRLDRIGRILGDASYVIYLFHPLLLLGQISVWASLAPATPIWIVVLTIAASTAACCVVISRLIEQRVIDATRALLGRLFG